LRLALPFTTLTGRDTVRLIAGEDFRYSLTGAGVESWLPEFLSRIDGRQTLESALGPLSQDRREAALEIVERLYGERVLVDGTVVDAHRAAKYRLVAEGCGTLRERLEARTSTLNEAGVMEQARPLVIFCQDRLDYAAALEFNRRRRTGADPWLWATYGPLARAYVSPLFWSDAGPCLHCLVRHFQRLSPVPALYDELMKRSGQEERISAVPFSDVALTMLEALALWKFSAASEPEAPPALYRLHVLEVGTMEVSTHRVFTDPECSDCGGGQ
jgi:bacteriocin biosynthesis cyclodehydratase domain-containing protein